MYNKMEMTLDEIIKSTKHGRRNNGRSCSAAAMGKNRNSNKRPVELKKKSYIKGVTRPGGKSNKLPQQELFTRRKINPIKTIDDRKLSAARTALQPANRSTKLIVSNLDSGVINTDIQELFAEFGALENVRLHYDAFGRSLGSAEVIYERYYDAVKAMSKYNNVPLDGKPMNIQITSEIPTPRRRTMKSKFENNMNLTSGGKLKKEKRTFVKSFKKRNQKNMVSLEELDAELDAYAKIINVSCKN